MNQDKEMTEWKLAQLFKLQAELAVFGGKSVPIWDKELTPEKVQIADNEEQNDSGRMVTLSEKYAAMWYSSRSGCLEIIDHATSETREACAWLLDKRLHLRHELEEYGMKVLPELAEALGENHKILQEIDEQWCHTWKTALALVTHKLK